MLHQAAFTSHQSKAQQPPPPNTKLFLFLFLTFSGLEILFIKYVWLTDRYKIYHRIANVSWCKPTEWNFMYTQKNTFDFCVFIYFVFSFIVCYVVNGVLWSTWRCYWFLLTGLRNNPSCYYTKATCFVAYCVGFISPTTGP